MFKSKLKNALEAAVQAAYPETADTSITLEKPRDTTHGDYACSVAMRLGKAVGENPRQVAETLIEALNTPDFIHSVEIAGPGFLNFFIKPEALAGELKTILIEGEKHGQNQEGKGQKIMLEYSYPNTNKPLHLGHARNNFVGMALSNILEANGVEVVRTQIVNDRGIHICKSMWAYEKWGRNTSPESVDQKGDHFVGDYYVKYAQEAKKNPEIEEEAKAMLEQWESGDEAVRGLWEKMNEWVWQGFNETYKRIGSEFEFSTFESDISEGGREIVEQALRGGKAETVDGGAIAIDLSAEGLGDSETGKKILIRSNGTTIYMTQDLKLAVDRMAKGDIDRLIYVVGNEQNYHFRALFKILEKFGYQWGKKCHHMSYGMVDLPSGKMKSREGTTVDLDSLLDELETLVEQEIDERNLRYPEEERENLVKAVALAALKYYILKVDHTSRMLYDPNSSIDFQGNTGPYLQYTYARLRSILRQAPEVPTEPHAWADLEIEPQKLQEAEEIAILRKLPEYAEMVELCGREYRIHPIATYLNELAQLTNTFYSHQPVLDGPSSELRLARLTLIAAVCQVLKNGIALLGIEAVERM